jgi:hypothetical protein
MRQSMAYIVINDGYQTYYLLKVERKGFDVYCFPPYLGMHYSVHETGQAHFTPEGKAGDPVKAPPVILLGGEAGIPFGRGSIREPLSDLGRAVGICTVMLPIDSLSTDFQIFNRSPKECFIIDKGLFPKECDSIEVGVWAVPERNKRSFEFNNPNISEKLLYRITSMEPQIWIYANPIGV